MKNDSNENKVFDVGKPLPQSTSRPIIVGHRPVMPDPMVNRPHPQTPAGKPTLTPVPAPPHIPKPPPQNSPTPQSADHTGKSIAVSPESQHEILKAAKPLDPQFANEPPASRPPAEPASIPAVPSQSPATPPMPPKSTGSLSVAIEAELAKPAETAMPPNLPPLPEANELHLQSVPVSHHSPHPGGELKFILIWAASITLVLIIGVYLFIDAGLIKSSIHLPFHIFNGQTSG